ncbi:MAG: PAS domain S-box protein [Pseudomonadota bacterium]|nr:PAS domain S-box protein [Pseudomonadota bacterium]
MRFSLFSKLLVGFLLVAMIPLGFGIVMFSQVIFKSQQLRLQELGQARLEVAENIIAERIGSIDRELRFLSQRLEGEVADQHFLRYPYEKNKEILKIIAADSKDRVQASLFRYGYIADETKVPHREFGGDRLISFVSWNQEPQLQIIYPLHDPLTSENLGTLRAEISLKNLFAELADYHPFSNSGQLYIVAETGKIVSHPDINLVLTAENVTGLPVVAAIMKGKTFAFAEYQDLDGQPVVGIARKISGIPLLVVNEIPRDQAYFLLHKLKKNFLFAFASALLLVLLTAWIIARSITRSMARLTAGTKQITDGDLDFSLTDFPRDEVGNLADHFNRMVTALKEDRNSRQLAEENLRLSEQRYRTITDFAYDMECWRDPAGKFLFVSPSCEELTGYAPAEFLADYRLMRKLVLPEDHHIFIGHRHEVTAEGRFLPIEFRIRRKDGKVRWFEHICRPVTGVDGENLGIRGSNRDITDRKRVEEILAAERERLAVTLRSIGDGVITVDTHGRVVMINLEAERMTGWDHEQAVGRPLAEIFIIIDENSRDIRENPVDQVLASDRPAELANGTVLVAHDGSELVIGDSAAPIVDQQGEVIGVVLVFRDLTEKQRLQNELLKAEKIKSVGLLAGGIAHDFNNLLQGIGGNLALARLGKSLPTEVDHKLEEAEKAVQRAAGLTQQLLTFSRGGAPVTKEVQLPELISESVSFALRGSMVKPIFNIAADLHLAVVDTGQISQVIHNLVLNADQAMPDGGEIEITAENIQVETEGEVETLSPGEYVKLTVRDQGSGIPREIMAQIFDPYFSTKDEGRGLGLASCYSIIKNHHGLLTAFSKPGAGATFLFYLPAARGCIEANNEKKEEVSLEKGSAKILVMDDDVVIQEILAEMLEFAGYESEITADGQQAVKAYQQAMVEGQPFAVVIADLTVPGGMGGEELMTALLKIDPLAKGIVSSGYSHDPVMADFAGYGFKAVIGKPYKMEELTQVLHEVLQGKGERRKVKGER